MCFIKGLEYINSDQVQMRHYDSFIGNVYFGVIPVSNNIKSTLFYEDKQWSTDKIIYENSLLFFVI